MTNISLKNLRPNLPKIVEGIDKKFDRVTVTKRGKPVVMMLSVEDYESMVETMNILSDKSGLARIKEGLKQAKTGQTVSLEYFRKINAYTKELMPHSMQ